ncbi:UDP-N-acetylglucosamine 1-carboxyvinyltransferase [Patescibacteria group bacterium]|nr:UDP-N-acetylglucosamine 1-carboxyvinyltransferase [Patescibacteria group bacterium]
MSETLKIIGGKKLCGEATPVPNKNAVLAALAACLLTDGTVTYKNVPDTTDVRKILQILNMLGARIDQTKPTEVNINCRSVNSFKLDQELGSSIRSSILFAGPLLVRFGQARIPLPGGCVLGKRAISAHVDAFAKVGIGATFDADGVLFTAPKAKSAHYDVWMMEASVTATENLAMYAAGTSGHFVITEAACEPHVRQLLELLSSMGADISGIGSNKLEIDGRTKLKAANFTPEPDFVDIAGLIVAAAVTKGKVTIKNACLPLVVDGLVQCFEKFHIDIKRKENDLEVDGNRELFIDPINSGFPLAGEDLPKLVPRPWPGFPIDVLPVMVTLACKTKGRLLIQNWMYETGLDFVGELNALGANIFVADPQRIVVNGPVNFRGGRVTSPSVIQACKAIFLASLADPVETIIVGADILKRRYPDIVDVYRTLGANVESVED